jgi:YD repeat-containing protein
MGFRHTLAAAFFFALISLAAAQTNPAPPAPADDTTPEDASIKLFSLSVLTETALSGDLVWRPDWPLAIPSDSFTSAAQGVSITLTLEAGSPADQGAAVPVEFRYTKEPTGSREPTQDSRGRLTNFPYFINGVFCQVQAFFNGQNGALGSMRVIGEGDPREIEFTRFAEGLPILGRVDQGGSYSFVVFQYLDRETTETWYDEKGAVLGFFSLKYRDLNGRRLVSVEGRAEKAQGGENSETARFTTYDYDSAGNISGVSAPEGNYAALYTAEGRLRYWEKPGGSYTLQWDEGGFLTRLTGKDMVEEIDIRYEYTSDARGSWTERQEIPLIRRFGILVPGSGLLVRRTLSYGTER